MNEQSPLEYGDYMKIWDGELPLLCNVAVRLTIWHNVARLYFLVRNATRLFMTYLGLIEPGMLSRLESHRC